MENKQQEAAPLVSFIIACYNLPVKLLSECINSILALSLSPDEREIIVVDDGSDVSLSDDLLPYGDNIVYVLQKHAGLSVARNTGIRIANGQYLQFIDGDDSLLKLPYDHCLDIIRRHQDADMVLFDFSEHDQESRVPAIEEVPPLSGTDYMRHYNIHGMACGYLFRRTILGDLRFTPGIFHEDEEFTPQLLIRAKLIYPTKAKAYYYNRRSASITTHQDSKHLVKRFNDIHQVIKHLKDIKDHLSDNGQLALERRVAQLTMDYLYNLMMQSTSVERLEETIQALRADGLFPLPNRHYSSKYTWFRRLTNSKFGRRILTIILPLTKRER